jgi:MFS family permease
VADHINLRWALRVALILACLALGIFYALGGYSWWLAASLLFGLSLGGMLPVWGAILARIYGRDGYARALSLSRMAMTPLNFGCPLLAGVIFDLTGAYRSAWILYLVLGALAFGITFLRSKPWEPE